MAAKTNEKFHSLADAFPLISGDEFEELVKDIHDNGLISPVVMYEGKILDGRNRWRACQRLGIPHTEKKFMGSDAAAYVWSVNAVRRQLTASQKALAAAKLVDAKAGMNQHSEEVTRSRVTTIGDAAKMAGVGERTVQEAKRVLDNAVEDVVDLVESGQLSVHAAERVAQLPKAEQKEILATVPAGEIHKAVADKRPVVHTSETPESDSPKGVGRGNVGPKVQLTRQLEASSAEGAKLRTRTWAENREIITELDSEKLDAFVKDLAAEARAISQLIRLIKIERNRNKEDQEN